MRRAMHNAKRRLAEMKRPSLKQTRAALSQRTPDADNARYCRWEARMPAVQVSIVDWRVRDESGRVTLRGRAAPGEVNHAVVTKIDHLTRLVR